MRQGNVEGQQKNDDVYQEHRVTRTPRIAGSNSLAPYTEYHVHEGVRTT